MAKNQTEIYKTKDLAEAAMLIVKGHELFRIDREGVICWFIFKNKDECEDLSNNYYFTEILVNARSFYEVMKRLKNLIFSQE
jgi:hypothetical protein